VIEVKIRFRRKEGINMQAINEFFSEVLRQIALFLNLEDILRIFDRVWFE
jgi:hypothetical protein